MDHRTLCRRWARWGGSDGAGAGAPAACSQSTPVELRAIESSMQDRARICKYRHIYKRKGSPERRTNAALRGNQSGEIPSTSDRKMSNELQVQHLPRVCDTRRGRHSTAALRSPPLCWYIYRLFIELVYIAIIRQLDKRQALKAGEGWAAHGATASAFKHWVIICTSDLHAAFRRIPLLWIGCLFIII